MHTQLRDMVKHQMRSCSYLYFNTTEQTPTIIAENYLLTYLEPLLNSFFVLLLLPVCNNIVAPLMGFYWPNMRKRVGLGFVLILLAAITSTLLEFNGAGSLLDRNLWFILPVFLTAIAEVSAASPSKCKWHLPCAV